MRTFKIDKESHTFNEDTLAVTLTVGRDVSHYSVVAAWDDMGASVQWCHDPDCARSYRVQVNDKGKVFSCTCPDYRYRVLEQRKQEHCKHSKISQVLVDMKKVNGPWCQQPQEQGA